MVQRLLHGDRGELFAPQVAEGAAAAGDDQPPDRGPLTRETLEDGRVLGVDRQDGGLVPAGKGHDIRAAHDERLLVGQRQFLARFERRDRGGQTGIADQGVHHDVDIACGGNLRHGLVARVDLRVGVGQRVAQGRVALPVGDDRGVGVELPGLRGQLLPVAVGRQRADLEAVGVLTHDVERLYADRTGRAQYGESLFHGL